MTNGREAKVTNFNSSKGNQWGVKVYTWKNGRIAKVETVPGRGNRAYALRVAATWNRRFANEC